MKTTSSRRSAWLVPGGLILLSLVPAIAGTFRLTELASGPEVTAANQRFVELPLPVILHILSVIPYSLVGAFQFSPEFRRRYRGWHRMAGRVLVVLGLIVALSGLWMTLVYPWANNDGEAVYLIRILVASAMFVSIALGIDAIRRRDFAAHGAWMIRAYAIALGAGTQVLTHLPWFILIGKTTELSRAIMMGAGWAINIVVAEWIIRSSEARQKPSDRWRSRGGSVTLGPASNSARRVILAVTLCGRVRFAPPPSIGLFHDSSNTCVARPQGGWLCVHRGPAGHG